VAARALGAPAGAVPVPGRGGQAVGGGAGTDEGTALVDPYLGRADDGQDVADAPFPGWTVHLTDHPPVRRGSLAAPYLIFAADMGCLERVSARDGYAVPQSGRLSVFSRMWLSQM
jgi:hypothetical protein